MERMPPCPGCGAAEGAEACRARFDSTIARDFGDARFFSVHRMLVDTYSLQHPDEHCVSAKSLAAHLVGLCLILEEGASAATGAAFLRDWLDGKRDLDKPPIPAERGRTTLSDLGGIEEPSAWNHAVRRWAESTWDSYEELHSIARRWAAEARAGRR